MGARRRAREQALQVLCLLDMQPDLSVEQALGLYYRHLQEPHAAGGDQADAAPGTAELPDPEARRFAEGLVHGVRGTVAEIDRVLAQSSRNWRLERMNWVDRNILRMAAHELHSIKSVPARVALNEAIELAKRFGTHDSAAFVNGVLDRVMEEYGRN